MVIGVHTPETADERDPANVARYLKDHDITYPVLHDAESENWKRWGQLWWPTCYLIDKKGYVRYRWAGELDYNKAGGEEIMGRLVQKLLREKS